LIIFDLEKKMYFIVLPPFKQRSKRKLDDQDQDVTEIVTPVKKKASSSKEVDPDFFVKISEIFRSSYVVFI
jgi:hypothetical protein